jgi:hypothetical protein
MFKMYIHNCPPPNQALPEGIPLGQADGMSAPLKSTG